MGTNNPVTGTFGATGQSASFIPNTNGLHNSIKFNASLWGTFVGSINLERSFDLGTTWLVCAADGTGTATTYTAPVSVVVEEPEQGVAYRFNCTAYTSGTVNYRLSQ